MKRRKALHSAILFFEDHSECNVFKLAIKDFNFDLLLVDDFNILEQSLSEHSCDLLVYQSDSVDKMDKFLALVGHMRHDAIDTYTILLAETISNTVLKQLLTYNFCQFLPTPLKHHEQELLAVLKSCTNQITTNKQRQAYQEELESAVLKLDQDLKVLQDDQKEARHTQKLLLPQKPLSCNGYHLQHCVIPSLYLSGDFIDYFLINSHTFVFVLADVSGHGTSSAFMTVLLRQVSLSLLTHYLKLSNSQEFTVSPARALSYMNQLLLKINLEKHVTVVGGIVDTLKHTLTCSFGGQYPYPIFTTPEKAMLIKGTGVPLGMFPDAAFEDIEIPLPSNSEFTLTLFSDGILELLQQDSLKEKEQYLLELISTTDCSIDSLKKNLGLEKLDDVIPDDIAILQLKRDSLCH